MDLKEFPDSFVFHEPSLNRETSRGDDINACAKALNMLPGCPYAAGIDFLMRKPRGDDVFLGRFAERRDKMILINYPVTDY